MKACPAGKTRDVEAIYRLEEEERRCVPRKEPVKGFRKKKGHFYQKMTKEDWSEGWTAKVETTPPCRGGGTGGPARKVSFPFPSKVKGLGKKARGLARAQGKVCLVRGDQGTLVLNRTV